MRRYNHSARASQGSCALWSFETWKPVSHASWDSAQMPGTNSLDHLARRAPPFREIRSGGRHAISTPGDILFHIRAKRTDLCFELAAQIMDNLGDVVSVADEVHGFRYFDERDVIGFVDGTENPRGGAAQEAAIVGDEDPAFAGGSYVIVQKYLHDMKGWNALPVETQERIIGRKNSRTSN